MTTLSHPIWGVGPGQFAQYRWSALSKPGEVKRSFKTHNTYVQMSAENGIPSLLLYLVVIWATFKTISRARKASATQSSPGLAVAFQLASCMELALAFFAVTALFMTIEAHPYLFILAGLAAANERLVQAELTRMQPPVQPSLPSGRWGPTFVGGA